MTDLTPFDLDASDAGTSLSRLASAPELTHLRALFSKDPARFQAFSCRYGEWLLDYSRQRMDAAIRSQLLALAEESRLRQGIDAMLSGAIVNVTEQRAVLHCAARLSPHTPLNARNQIEETLARVMALVDRIHAGTLTGSRGTPIRHVVHLGIGGSDLGPRVLSEAFSTAYPRRLKVSFAANVDASEIRSILIDATPEETLFVVASKSFTTAETLSNARIARQWLTDQLGPDADVRAHFAAISNNVHAASSFGVPEERIFPLPEWVGGRFSVWSAIGIPIMLEFGTPVFLEFLAGGRDMDAHFATAPFDSNLPVLAALIGLWNASYLRINCHAVLPYCHALRSLPAYLQQLEMESNGKHVRRDGSALSYPTAPILFGGAGTVGQHAYHQLFYQGTETVALDFIVPIPDTPTPATRSLVGNALAQAAALMHGRTEDEARAELTQRGLAQDEVERLAPHLVCPGNQPSSTLLMPALTPFTVGQLIALYEHKVFAQGWMWGLNSFDQYGVELGKQLARRLESGDMSDADSSTQGLMADIARRWEPAKE